MNLLFLGLLAGLLIVTFALSDWRRAIKVGLFLVVIEGALRKWVLPQASDLVFFLKDVFFAGAYIRYFLSSDEGKSGFRRHDPAVVFFFLAYIVTLLQTLNPRLGTPIVGLMGVKGYLIYIPLIWIVPDLFSSQEELKNYLQKYLLLSIPVGILGIVQFFSPPNSPLNIYAGDHQGYIATFGDRSAYARISSTFSYLDTYVMYLVVCFGLLIPLLSATQPKWWKLASPIILLLVTVNSFMTGSRSCVFASLLFVILYFIFKGTNLFSSDLRLFRNIIFPFIIIGIVAYVWFRPAINAFWLRTTSSSDSVIDRYSRIFLDVFDVVDHSGVFGYGTGSTQAASIALRNVFSLTPGEKIPVAVEEEPERIMLELGLAGFLIWYSFRFYLLITVWQVFKKLKQPLLKDLALAIFIVHLIQFPDQLVTHHVFAVYYWFLMGLVFALPTLETNSAVNRHNVLTKNNDTFAHFSVTSYR